MPQWLMKIQTSEAGKAVRSNPHDSIDHEQKEPKDRHIQQPPFEGREGEDGPQHLAYSIPVMHCSTSPHRGIPQKVDHGNEIVFKCRGLWDGKDRPKSHACSIHYNPSRIHHSPTRIHCKVSQLLQVPAKRLHT